MVVSLKQRIDELSDELIALYTDRESARAECQWGRMRRLEARIVEKQAERQALAGRGARADREAADCHPLDGPLATARLRTGRP
jgi:hypothetical protein